MRFMGVPENGPFETPKRTLNQWESYDEAHVFFLTAYFHTTSYNSSWGCLEIKSIPLGKIMVFPMSLPMRTTKHCWCPRVGWFCIQDFMTPLQVNPYPITIPWVSQDYSSLKPHNTPQRWIGRLILQFFFWPWKIITSNRKFDPEGTGYLERDQLQAHLGSWGYFQLVVIDPISWDIADSPVTIIIF